MLSVIRLSHTDHHAWAIIVTYGAQVYDTHNDHVFHLGRCFIFSSWIFISLTSRIALESITLIFFSFLTKSFWVKTIFSQHYDTVTNELVSRKNQSHEYLNVPQGSHDCMTVNRCQLPSKHLPFQNYWFWYSKFTHEILPRFWMIRCLMEITTF